MNNKQLDIEALSSKEEINLKETIVYIPVKVEENNTRYSSTDNDYIIADNGVTYCTTFKEKIILQKQQGIFLTKEELIELFTKLLDKAAENCFMKSHLLTTLGRKSKAISAIQDIGQELSIEGEFIYIDKESITGILSDFLKEINLE